MSLLKSSQSNKKNDPFGGHPLILLPENINMTIEQAQKLLQELLAKGCAPHEALAYAANKAASKQLSYFDAKQMLAFLQFGIN